MRRARRRNERHVSVRGADPFSRVLVGQFLPIFQLKSVDGRVYRTTEFLGRRLVLFFYGLGDDRSRRTMQRLQTIQPALRATETDTVSVSPFVVDLGQFVDPGIPVTFPLLCDTNSDVHRHYGAVDWSGQAAPSLFVADRWGRLIFRSLAGLGETLPSSTDLLALLDFDALAPRRPG